MTTRGGEVSLQEYRAEWNGGDSQISTYSGLEIISSICMLHFSFISLSESPRIPRGALQWETNCEAGSSVAGVRLASWIKSPVFGLKTLVWSFMGLKTEPVEILTMKLVSKNPIVCVEINFSIWLFLKWQCMKSDHFSSAQRYLWAVGTWKKCGFVISKFRPPAQLMSG